jgi:hypothetical protein
MRLSFIEWIGKDLREADRVDKILMPSRNKRVALNTIAFIGAFMMLVGQMMLDSGVMPKGELLVGGIALMLLCAIYWMTKAVRRIIKTEHLED